MDKIKINKRYAGILASISIMTIAFMYRLKNIQWKQFFVYMLIGTILGETWQIYTSHADPTWPGWWYAPGKVLGYIGKVSIEDILFYPICGAFFFCIKRILPKVKLWHNDIFNVITLILFLIVTGFFVVVGNAGGLSIIAWFALPGLVLLVFNMHILNFVNFISTGIFIVGFASVWDLLIKDWLYVTSNFQHSNLWINASWAWIGNSPIEITPWFSIAGWVFIYNLDEFSSNILKGNNPWKIKLLK